MLLDNLLLILVITIKNIQLTMERLPKHVREAIEKQDRESRENEHELKTGGPKTLEELAEWMNQGRNDDITLYASKNPKVEALLHQLIALAEKAQKELEECKKPAAIAAPEEADEIPELIESDRE
jgi:hypothetical protein